MAPQLVLRIGVQPVAPAVAMRVLGGHLALEVLADPRLVVQLEEVDQPPVGALAVAVGELVEADHVQALGWDLAHRRVDAAQPLRPPIDPLEPVTGVVALLALGDLGGARVAAVAHCVDQLGVSEHPQQRRPLGDVVGAHLDEGGLVGLLG